jgi:glycosyltransferase involved in cell wall biosynthesis
VVESPSKSGKGSARVAIGLPVYNGQNYVRDAVESILAQSYGDFRLIITDNCSTDGTQDICREYAARDRRIEYHRHAENIGAAPNFNSALHYAPPECEFFKWAAHDDVLGRDFLMIEESHGKNTLNLVLAVAYLRKLLDHAGVVKYLSQRHPDILGEFQKLADAPDLKGSA